MFHSEPRIADMKDMKAAKKEPQEPQTSQAYSTPQLVVLGQAHNLVQGGDLYKLYLDAGGHYYDP